RDDLVTGVQTCALPILLGVRIAVGVLEAIALGVGPWVTIFFVSSAAGMPVLLRQVEFYVLLLVGGGLAYFAMAILVSSLVEGERSEERRVGKEHRVRDG